MGSLPPGKKPDRLSEFPYKDVETARTEDSPRGRLLNLHRPDSFSPENHPELALDYLFETLCAARRVARANGYAFVGYLIEMAVLEVDNERAIDNRRKSNL